jgi:hypothetical protein
MSQVREAVVWRALEECAPGYSVEEKTHRKWIFHNGKVYRGFPKGEHGTRNPEVEIGHVRRLARFFEILCCLRTIVSQL